MITSLAQIVKHIKGRTPRRLAVACGEDPHTIEAVGRAVAEGLVQAVLTGNRSKIESVARDNKIDPASFEIVDEPDPGKALARAVARIKAGESDFLMKGLIDSSLYIKAIIDKEKGLLAPGKLLSHVSVIQVPSRRKLIVCADAAVIPYPDLEAKVQILNYCLAVARKLGIDRPKAAIICAVEKVNPKMVPTTDAAILSKMADRGQIKDADVDGPLALDVALSAESAEIKGVRSPIAGEADVLLFPSIETGNVFFKACSYLAGGETAAVVAGTDCPCVLTSRSDSEDSKFYSIALGALIS
ncbi:MAG TPA: bifunctional enoyl-CoA hydratase/phosphate acetyltransferase [Candidatus Aminicenantes bacterium]|nr:bifunctional enoyl-CoA hydratase/phosphate acetyltransferase [Acidobacteriota bacterium]OQB59146.1 MAG: Phosphate acetyltransferase [Candidatus Aminicenantes bacterium ADurb.Bin147]HNQ79891.1 bifunctional enoyl-CoA hydratase/phosphate acetyltransferase [Candidatus Aminicenantes bacterium]HNT31387.1 bifunctional enoyl-CoA hydratase/phosphate acetyltransferase [Candidatus Aminicenantes bacterium]HOY99384.1 bifunctional enoyl-CoA hydratase/phosphate acetyltransferase [Candidatus Aminicenantes b